MKQLTSFLAVCVLSSCGAPAPTCVPATCEGCCDASGNCRLGSDTRACGTRGQACDVCVSEAGQQCVSGACVFTAPRNDGGVVPDAGADPNACRAAFPRSQGLSAPCCPTWGTDACGATLFCAAFDGRTQPTCYLERSRADQAECTADLQCTSGSCNPTARRCRSLTRMPCTTAVGCAASGERCLHGECSSGGSYQSCEARSDCSIARPACVDFRCTTAKGVLDLCQSSDQCESIKQPNGAWFTSECIGGSCKFRADAGCSFRASESGWVCAHDPGTQRCQRASSSGFCLSNPSQVCTASFECTNVAFDVCLVSGRCP